MIYLFAILNLTTRSYINHQHYAEPYLRPQLKPLIPKEPEQNYTAMPLPPMI